MILMSCCDNRNKIIYPCDYSENPVSTNGELFQEHIRMREEFRLCSGIKK